MFARGMFIQSYKQLKECLFALWLHKIAIFDILLQSPGIEAHPK